MKRLVLIFLLLLLIPTAVYAQDTTVTPTPEPEEVTLESVNARLAEIEKKIDILIIALVDLEEVKAKISVANQAGDNDSDKFLELGNGIYRVPEDMKYGVWKYQSADNKSCFVKTHSDVSTDINKVIDIQNSPNGYITIDSRVKLVDFGSLASGDCTIKWVSEK